MEELKPCSLLVKEVLDEIQRQKRELQMLDDSFSADKIITGLYRAECIIKKVFPKRCWT